MTAILKTPAEGLFGPVTTAFAGATIPNDLIRLAVVLRQRSLLHGKTLFLGYQQVRTRASEIFDSDSNNGDVPGKSERVGDRHTGSAGAKRSWARYDHDRIRR